jgi:hypothetical protein
MLLCVFLSVDKEYIIHRVFLKSHGFMFSPNGSLIHEKEIRVFKENDVTVAMVNKSRWVVRAN